MATDKLFFEAIKKDRDGYFVAYHPPRDGYKFAMLSLVVLDSRSPDAVAAAMESELKEWLRRYSVPLLVSAFDAKGDLIGVEGTRASSHLIGYCVDDSETAMFWRLLKDSEIPDTALGSEALLRIYAGVPYQTSSQTRHAAEAHARQLRIGWAVVFLWLVVGPAVWAILEWGSPAWVGVLVLGYSLWQSLVKGLKLSGKWKTSPKELKAQEEAARIRQHYYHCERNPEGFLRIKLENFEREERDRIQSEAKSLKAAGEG
jgi:hypothetical protein